MKTLFNTLLFAFSVLTVAAQAPQKMTYQAVVRNASDILITNASVGMQVSILQGSPTGLASYIETHTPTTNINGLATIEIGGGSAVAGSFSTIDWGNGTYFLKTEIDPNGGTAYTISGTTQLLSVPYALYAESTGSSFSGDYNDLTNTPSNLSDFTNDVGFITSPNDADSDPTNEIQTLSVVGSDLTISGGNTVTLPGATGNTLDAAYDQGGAGAGRTITADAGAVEIINSGSNLTGLDVTSAVANSTGVLSTHSGVGVALRAESSNPANSFAAIQGNTNSSNINNSAILGNNSGAGYGVSGQIPSTATGEAAVYGNNLRTTGGYGVLGIGYNGVVGQSNYIDGFAVYGSNSSVTGLGIGTYGIGFNGIYGQTTDVTNGWSGYFTQDIGVDGAGYSIGGWFTVSDKRLKSNIQPISSPLDRLMLINGRRYVLTTTAKPYGEEVSPRTTEQYGVIAQEVEAVFPEMVSQKAVLNNAGDNTVYKTVNYDQLIPVLIEAVKELNLKVEDLEEQIEQLKQQQQQ
jgi:hypothetical protein